MSISCSEAVATLLKGGRQPQLDGAITAVERTATSEGLREEHVKALIEFVATKTASAPTCCRVIRCLIPRRTVPCSAVVRLLSCLPQQPLPLQLLLLRWLVLVHDLIDDHAPLHELYDVIFYYLQFDDLRAAVCQLLCYLTAMGDVRDYRVQKLTDIQKRVVGLTGSEPHLSALLAVYKLYSPHLTSVSLPATRRKVWFRPFEKALAANIKRIQSLNQQQQQQQAMDNSCGSSSAGRFLRHMQAAPPPAKRSKLAVTAIPSVLPPSAHVTSGDHVTTPVGHLTTVGELCDSIHTIELPGQMAAVLDSELMKHVLVMWSDPSAALRLVYWLEHTLGYELDEYSPGCESPQLKHLLQRLQDLTDFLLEPIPTVESFLMVLLEEWSGEDYQSEVLGLLSHLSLQPFGELYVDYLEPLRRCFFERDWMFKVDCVEMLTRLLSNFVNFELPRIRRRGSTDKTSGSRASVFYHGNEDDPLDFDPTDTLRQFIKYADELIRTAALLECGWESLKHSACCFYSMVSALPEVHGVLLVAAPHHSLLYRALLSPEPATLSTLCSSLVSCKNSFRQLPRSQRDPELTHAFNTVVLDLCDSLWRNQAFSAKPDSTPYPSRLFTMDRDVLSAACDIECVHERLNIVHHPAFAGYVRKFFRDTQGAGNNFAPNSIWKESRSKDAYLEFLKLQHLHGIVAFVRTFILSAS